MTIEDLLDASAFAICLEKLDRVFCNVGRHWPDPVWVTRQRYENIEPVTILKTGAASKAPYTRLLPQDLLYMTRSRNPLALFFYCLANISFII